MSLLDYPVHIYITKENCDTTLISCSTYTALVARFVSLERREGGGGCLFNSDTDNSDIIVRFVCLWIRFHFANLLDCLHTFSTSTKHGVFVVQPRLQNANDKRKDRLIWLKVSRWRIHLMTCPLGSSKH